MAKTKQVLTVEDLETIDDVNKFRLEVLRPMEPGEEKRALRVKLQEKARAIRLASKSK